MRSRFTTFWEAFGLLAFFVVAYLLLWIGWAAMQPVPTAQITVPALPPQCDTRSCEDI